jgi:hypothetical protein
VNGTVTAFPHESQSRFSLFFSLDGVSAGYLRLQLAQHSYEPGFQYDCGRPP